MPVALGAVGARRVRARAAGTGLNRERNPNRGLLIHTRNGSVLRCVQIQSDDVSGFVVATGKSLVMQSGVVGWQSLTDGDITRRASLYGWVICRTLIGLHVFCSKTRSRLCFGNDAAELCSYDSDRRSVLMEEGGGK